ncbi:MAG: hypothetical protein KDA75_20770, partial [Planctomycetaceae bacterium]|nr:hypothetical protein [Planctomycetaceae bacterium]
MVTGIVTGLLCLAAWLTWLGNRRVRFTTLKTAARWGLAAVAVWLTAWVWDRFATGYRQPWGDFLWYLAGLTTISMFVAVLGAKRPGVRAWPWFVLLPLVTVFSLPVIAAAWPFSHGTSVRVPLPLMIGFAVVLLMGAGNYVGTRYSMAAALSAVAVCLVVAPLSDAAPVSLFLLGDPRVVGSICFSSAVIVAYRQSLRPTIGHTPVERLWF